MDHFQLLLATNRPAIRIFFESLQERSGHCFTLAHVPVSIEALASSVSDQRQLCDADVSIAAMVDVLLDPKSATEFCQQLHDQYPDMPIVALLCCPHALAPSTLQSLLAAGVSSLVDLQATPEATVRILCTIAHGDSVLYVRASGSNRAGLRDLLWACQHSDKVGVQHELTEQERDLIKLVAYGLSDAKIGKQLHMSSHTVKHQIERVRAQVGAANRTELAAWAGLNGLYNPPATAAEPQLGDPEPEPGFHSSEGTSKL